MANEKFIFFRDDKIFSAIAQEGYERNPNHKYLLYSDKAPTGFISISSELLTKTYFDNLLKQTINKWKKDSKEYTISYPHPKTGVQLTSNPINYKIIAQELRANSCFDPIKYNLPAMGCSWLDISLDTSQNFHFIGNGEENALFIHDGSPAQHYGENYPIKPKLDREGHIFTTFQPALIRRIIKLRKSLIDNSEGALFSDWILDLRSLINDAISLLDINLNQLYNKAEYSPENGWTFDKELLGTKNNRRIKDKLKWVRQITGRPFNIEAEFNKLNRLRKLRNHLNHFDPPTLVISIEEAVEWINDILHVGMIIVKFRQALNVQISPLIIELICQKEAIFNPEPAFAKRTPIKDSGYVTSTWPDEDNNDEI